MSEDAVEEDVPILATTHASDDVKINAMREHHMALREEIRQGFDGVDTSLARGSIFAQANTIGDLTLAPIRKVPVELMAEIFVLCIPSLTPEDPEAMQHLIEAGMHPQQVRAKIGLVCRVWNTILNSEPRAWVTLALDHRLPARSIVSQWIKKSKSLPLDVYLYPKHWFHKVQPKHDWYGDQMQVKTQAILAILHRQIWRIRYLIAIINASWEISALFPPGVSTDAPMMQILTLLKETSVDCGLGGIQCPKLHTLTLSRCDEAITIVKPMQNVHHLHFTPERNDLTRHRKLFHALPNLISLTWRGKGIHDELPRVVLQYLRSLKVELYRGYSVTRFLACLHVPLLEHLDLSPLAPHGSVEDVDTVLSAICGDGTVRLRSLALRHTTLSMRNFCAVMPLLENLETLIFEDLSTSADELLIALSPPDCDFRSVCPQLTRVELVLSHICRGPLVDFVERRVVSDLDEPAPGLVTCLKLTAVSSIDRELCMQLAEYYSKSIHIGFHKNNSENDSS